MSNLSDLIERARYRRDYGNFDGLHAELLDMVEFLDHEFEAERDRATEHFDARMTMQAALGDAWDDGNGAGLDGGSDQAVARAKWTTKPSTDATGSWPVT